MRPLLTVGYSCLAERVSAIAVPPAHDDVEYLLCVQGATEIEAPWARVIDVSGLGVAKSRNAAIDHASGRFLHFCDDDVRLSLSGVRAGIEHLRRSDAAIALGRSVDPAGALRKRYSDEVRSMTRLNSAKAATFELLIDVDQVREAGVRFDERFGAGMPLYLGDEFIFAADVLSAGHHGIVVPETFGMHPFISSGDRWGTRDDSFVRAVVLNRVFGRLAPLARTAFAVKHGRRLGGVRQIFRFIRTGTRPHRECADATPDSRARAEHSKGNA